MKTIANISNWHSNMRKTISCWFQVKKVHQLAPLHHVAPSSAIVEQPTLSASQATDSTNGKLLPHDLKSPWGYLGPLNKNKKKTTPTCLGDSCGEKRIPGFLPSLKTPTFVTLEMDEIGPIANEKSPFSSSLPTSQILLSL